MLHTVTELKRFTLGATDGAIGSVGDLYFDDEKWVIRYLIVITGRWPSRRKVLISRTALGNLEAGRILPVSINRRQVRASPGVDTERPVSRQYEMYCLGDHGYPYYWEGNGLGRAYPNPGMIASSLSHVGNNPAYRLAQAEKVRTCAEAAAQRHKRDDRHLRSCETIMTYRLRASDGNVGRVCDFVVDEKSWAIRYLVVRVREHWNRCQVLIEPGSIAGFDCSEKVIRISLTRNAVRLRAVAPTQNMN